jgi:hypothetical protein
MGGYYDPYYECYGQLPKILKDFRHKNVHSIECTAHHTQLYRFLNNFQLP